MDYVFSDHREMQLEVNNKGKTGKFIKLWKLSNILFKYLFLFFKFTWLHRVLVAKFRI